MNKEEIKKDNRAIKISMPLLTEEEMLKIDNNFNEIVDKIKNQFIKEKDLAIAQYIINKQQKELEQKESILDKVTDKLNKNQASDYQALTEIEYRLRKMNRKEYDTNGHGRYLADLRDILLNRIEYQQEILNIIEGEKK